MKKSFLVLPLAAAAIFGQACSGPGEGDPTKGPGGTGDGDLPGDGDLGDGDGDLGLGLGGDGDAFGNAGEENWLGLKTSVILEPECASDCTGFSDPENPEAPLVIVDEGVDTAALDAGGTPDGFCLEEPANGTIFPAGWTRPRFNASGQTGPAKITLSSAKMKHDFVYYSASMPAILPVEAWEAISKNVYNEDITYTVVSGGAQVTGSFQVAPVAAGGSMVFWGSEGTQPGEATNALYGFGVGDEGVIDVIQPGEIAGTSIVANRQKRTEQTTTEGHSTCVGCHSSTPDGRAVASVDHWPWNIRLYSIEPGAEGTAPEWFTPAGAAMVQMSWLGGSTFSLYDWSEMNDSRRRMVTTWTDRDYSTNNIYRIYDSSALSTNPLELVWMDLAVAGEAPVDLARVAAEEYTTADESLNTLVSDLRGSGWDVIARTGDTNSAVLPDWSHDGQTIVYTSTDGPNDGRIGMANAVSIYKVPFGNGAGGTAEKVPGASSDENFEYYPDLSPDDSLVAFNRIPKTSEEVYYVAQSDIYVTGLSGGEAVRLASNDATCGEGTAGSMYNSWAKWAPSSAGDGNRSYYFLIFSTTRNSPGQILDNGQPKDPASQLYMTTVIKEADGSITSSPAIYLWNQRNLVTGEGDAATTSELLTNNVTPAWDEFKIPPVPTVLIK